MPQQTLKYLSKTPCVHQKPETVKEFLTAMLPHKLTKLVCFFFLNNCFRLFFVWEKKLVTNKCRLFHIKYSVLQPLCNSEFDLCHVMCETTVLAWVAFLHLIMSEPAFFLIFWLLFLFLFLFKELKSCSSLTTDPRLLLRFSWWDSFITFLLFYIISNFLRSTENVQCHSNVWEQLIILLKERNTFIQQGLKLNINLNKNDNICYKYVTKQIISILNRCCSFELSMHQRTMWHCGLK